MITIIDYGMGNLGSIKNMLKKIGFASIISNDKEEIMKAEKIIIPGVGAFNKAMENLKKLELIEVLRSKTLNNKVPTLGICLGMQLLADSSEEGNIEGLGLVPGRVTHFNLEEKYKVPHMGWNNVEIVNDSILFKTDLPEHRFYFVHSYYYQCKDQKHVIGESQYGIKFTCAVQNGNIFGTQFHPEKSHKYGMRLLKSFAELT
jgi:imidazole glycerol-phosphate synthase subunit HisH